MGKASVNRARKRPKRRKSFIGSRMEAEDAYERTASPKKRPEREKEEQEEPSWTTIVGKCR